MKPERAGLFRHSTLLLLWLIAGGTQSVWPQSDNAAKPDIQQLQVKLELMQSQMQQLKDEIVTLQHAEQQPSATEVALQAPQGQPPVTEAATQTPAPTEKPAAEEKPPGKGEIEIYGFAQLDAGYEWGQSNPDWFDVMRPTKLDSFPDEFAPDGKVYFSVRQSRFGVKTSNPTKFGDLKTIFEFELFGTGVDAGQTTFRLRHAYGELGQFGGGQTWSPFMDIDVFPNSLEYWGPNGMVFFRNVQFRWMPIRGKSRVTIALERPGASADQGVYAGRIELQGVKPKFDMPDISAEARLGRSWGYFEVAGILRKISWVDLNRTPERDLSDTVWGWGINLSSNVKLGKNNTGRFQVVGGEGIQNYMNDAPTDVGIENNFSNSRQPIKGVPLPMIGIVAFVDHSWSEKFTSSIGYSMLNIWNSDAQLGSEFHQGQYALTNLLYTPIKNVMMGGEFQWGRRINFFDGFNVNDYRFQFTFKVNFSKMFSY
jgi:hypothetical protein